MNVKKCDRCGRIYKPGEGEGGFKVKFCDIFWRRLDEKYNEKFDLCSQCGQEFKDVLGNFLAI